MTKDCLEAAGIKQTVWIDDHFASADRTELITRIIEAAVMAKEEGAEILAALPSINVKVSKAKLTIDIQELLEETSTKDLLILSESIWDTISASASGRPTQNDLSAKEFADLEKALGAGVTTMGLGGWTSTGAERFAKCSVDTLFLVDKEFTREDPLFDGGRLIAEIARKRHAFCVLLTHRCANAKEEVEARESLARTYKVPFHKFTVLSKRPGVADENIDRRFARAFSTVMTQRFTGDIALELAKTIKSSAKKTAQRLAHISVADVDRAIFINSAREGVAEFDVLVRIFRVLQTKALNDSIRTAALQGQLRTIRAFAKKTRGFQMHPLEDEPLREFREWRKNEVFEDGTGLNAVHSPLVCGDIFEFDKDKTRYILIGQGCDLVMRKEGTRRASLAFLMAIDGFDAGSQPPGSQYRRFELGRIFGYTKVWHVDFQKRIIADLDVLDLAVFNKAGIVSFHQNVEQPNIALTEGWERRLTKIKPKFVNSKGKLQKVALSLGPGADKLKARIRRGILSYPLRRVGRLESNTSTATLAAWATFETRAALQHDFAAPEVGVPVPTAKGEPQASANRQA